MHGFHPKALPWTLAWWRGGGHIRRVARLLLADRRGTWGVLMFLSISCSVLYIVYDTYQLQLTFWSKG
jgi:hypothetical protein